MQFTGQTEQQTVGARVERLPGWVAYAVVAAVAACLFALRMAAPPTLLDQDQERPAAYVLDAVRNGHWLCQRDLTGDITSKPPLYTWLCALIALGIGRVNQFGLYLPGALAALGSALLVLRAGSGHFGARTGFLAALAIMLTSAGLKEFGLARTDGVFAFTVTAAALLAYRAWVRGTGWMWFWLAAAAATLTKGPLGLVLASTGLLASPWILHGLRSRRREEADSQQQNADSPPHVGGYSLTGCHADHEISGLGLRAQLPGMLLFLALTCGWFLLAYREFGRPLAAKMLGQEFIGHAVEGGGHFPGALIYQQPLYYLGRAAPWSLLAYYGLWRVWRRPAQEALERRFERFLFCWFVPGLALFSLAPHQRGDLLWPLMPAGALIAGREL